MSTLGYNSPMRLRILTLVFQSLALAFGVVALVLTAVNSGRKTSA